MLTGKTKAQSSTYRASHGEEVEIAGLEVLKNKIQLSLKITGFIKQFIKWAASHMFVEGNGMAGWFFLSFFFFLPCILSFLW